MKVNLSGVEPWGAAEQLPPGDYVVKVAEAEEATSKNLNPMLIVDLEVVVGDMKGAEHREWITITERSLGRVVGILEAFGVPVPDGEFDLTPKMLLGKRCTVALREDTYNGETRVKVKAWTPAPGADVPADEPAPKPAKASAKKAEAKSDDDLPF